MKNYLDKLPQENFNTIMLYNSHPVSDLFKQEFDTVLKYYIEDDPRFGTFCHFVLFIKQCKKEEREEIKQREREHRYNSDSDFRDIPYHNNLVSDTESDSD